MVRFNYTLDGYEVLVDGQRFGYITKERGLNINPFTVTVSLTLTSYDLITIAKKVEEVRAEDKAPDRICRNCQGTPNFPNEVPEGVDGATTCRAPIHQYRVK